MQIIETTTNARTDLLEDVLNLLSSVQSIASKLGVKTTLSSPQAEQIFLSWDERLQWGLHKKISDWLDIFKDFEFSKKEETPQDIEIECVQRALWKYGLFARDAFSNYIESGDIVEIYNRDNVQIYRNFEFLKHCSYSLMDIITREWVELYERPQVVQEHLFYVTEKVFKQEVVVKPDLLPHIMREKASDQGRCFETELKWFIPLFSTQGRCEAFLATIKAELIDSVRDSDSVIMI